METKKTQKLTTFSTYILHLKPITYKIVSLYFTNSNSKSAKSSLNRF